MCSPQFSSQIEKEYKAIGWAWNEPPKSFGFNSIVDLATVKKIYCAGGEPSLMPEFRTFLTRAVEAGRTDIEILMNTNATNLNKEYLELLTRFDTVRIVCSIDGFDDVNKYIRWPADWATITKNIQGIANMTPWLGFNITISIWNIAKLSPLVNFLEINWPNAAILLNHVMFPPHQMFTNFPDIDVALADLEKLRNTTSYSRDESFRNKVEYYINKVKTNTLDVDNLVKFFEYNDTLDQSRQVELKDYIPELESCRRLIT
jgi:sulfatase maturation enzyme AslB (radical SAM superfamily)